MDRLEQTIFETTQELGKKTMEKFAEDYDRALMQGRDSSILRHAGKRCKHFMTRMGDIQYQRTRYIDKNTGKSVYLLDKKLGIQPNQRISLKRSQMEILLASYSSYRRTQEDIGLLTGQRRSHEAGRQSILKEAKRVIAHENKQIAQIKNLQMPDTDPKSDVAYIETDSTYIRLQRSRKREFGRKVGRKRLKRSLEIKLGIGYTGKESRYAHGALPANSLSDKFSFVGTGQSFMERLSIISEKKLSLYRVKQIIMGGDGAPWIKEGMKDHFPNAVYFLCRFHLNRAVRRALSLRKDSQKTLLKFIREDRINQALGLIKRMISHPKDKKEKEKLQDLHSYIDNNRDGINSKARIVDKSVRESIQSTGCIEPNIDKFIAHRFKGRGMSWSKKGALALLKIKQIINNNEWNDWWSKSRDEKLVIPHHLQQIITSTQMNKKQTRKNPFLIQARMPLLETQYSEYAELRRRMKELTRIDYKLGEIAGSYQGRGEQRTRWLP